MIDKYKKVVLKDGNQGVIVDYLGTDYVIDIGTSSSDWDTILVKQDDIAEVINDI